MNSKRLTILLPFIILVTLVASLITPAPVLAAGEPPPPVGEKNPKATAPAKAAPALPASDDHYTAEAPMTSPAGDAAAATVALSVEAIAQAGAVLVGPSGNPLPMAARDTVIALDTPDAYFKCPGCAGGYAHFSTINDALAAFPGKNGSGPIYANGALSEAAAVDINGATLNLSKLTGLSWDQVGNYTPVLNDLLTIEYMLKGFTVEGFSILKGLFAHDNAGTLRLQNLYVTNPNGTGIFINNHEGNIDLFNITVAMGTFNGGVDNLPTYGDGAYLDNCIWNDATAKCAGTGNVTIRNSSFNDNWMGGLYVFTNGSVLLERVETNGNGGDAGAYLIMKKGATVKDSRFNNNGDYVDGLKIEGAGTLSLQNVEASANGAYGMHLHIANDIIINGGLFTNNASYSMDAFSINGNITLNNIRSIDNKYGVTTGNSYSQSAKTVKVTNSIFNGTTGSRGLGVAAKGNVTLNHIDAENNDGGGIAINNALYYGNNTYDGSGSVSLLDTLGPNQFINNGGPALSILSKGAITVKGVYASGNVIGLRLDSCALDHDWMRPTHYCLGKGNVTLSAVTIENSPGNDDLDGGSNVLTGGAISLDGSRFNANRYGVVLDNSQVAVSKPVTVTHSSFNNTFDPASVGLAVYSRGGITLNNVQANANQGKLVPDMFSEPVSGILLDNCMYDYSAAACTGSGSVNVINSLGQSQTEENPFGYGLFVFSHGSIHVNGFASTRNGEGAYFNNEYGNGTLTINSSSFSDNSLESGGLRAFITRSVTLNRVEASNNTSGQGVIIVNNYGMTPAFPITITQSRFNNNHLFGLNTAASGNLTLNNVSASQNNATVISYGALLESSGDNVSVLDTLGANQFNFNQAFGLKIYNFSGAISIRGVTASFNSAGSGIKLSQTGTTPKPVTAEKINAENNGVDGLQVLSSGGVTLNKVQANSNITGFGVFIENSQGSGNVSLLSTLGSNSMSYNQCGLWITAAGSVVVTGVTASYNAAAFGDASGAFIANTPVINKPVTITQSNFNYNHGTGLLIHSKGVVTLNNIGASYNLGASGNGLFLDNVYTGAPRVNILSTFGNNQFIGNAANGLSVNSSGNITLSKVIASDNGLLANLSGAVLNTTNASSITITCSAFNHNGNYGLEVTMGSGMLAFKSVSANGNNIALQQINQTGGTRTIAWQVCGH